MTRRTTGRLTAFRLTVLVCAAACVGQATAQTTAESPDGLRGRFPPSTIDSVEKADAALAATGGAKPHVEQDFKAAAGACIGTVLVNDCLDRAREQRRQRMADIDAIELEANRFKRRDRSDHLERERVRREAARAAAAPADAAQRERNRQAYEKKQADAARAASDHATSDARRTVKNRPAPKPQGDAAVKQAERAKNASDYTRKVQAAAEHREEIDRRLAQKTVDRKRRDEAKAAKDAKTAAAISAAAAARTP